MDNMSINPGSEYRADVPRAAGESKVKRPPDRRGQVANFLLACAWPFLAAALYVVTFSRHRAYTAFVIFCVAAGWSYAPTIGSDGHFAVVEIERLKAGMPITLREPAIRALVYFHAKLGLSESFYFALLGLFYGLAVGWCGKLMLLGRPSTLPLGRTAAMFAAGFFLFYPVFAALNARYTLGMWIMFASTLLALQGRWRTAGAVGGRSTERSLRTCHFRCGAWIVVGRALPRQMATCCCLRACHFFRHTSGWNSYFDRIKCFQYYRRILRRCCQCVRLLFRASTAG